MALVSIPSSITGPVRRVLQDLADAVNGLPQFSFFSGTSPNSVLTGSAGAFAINVGSASTESRVWINTSTSAASTSGWVILRIAEP